MGMGVVPAPAIAIVVAKLVSVQNLISVVFWRKGKDPHPQDKIQHLDFTKDPPAALLQDASLCILAQKSP